VDNDWLPVEAEAHQSWPPKKKSKNRQTNKTRKTEKEREITKYIIIHRRSSAITERPRCRVG